MRTAGAIGRLHQARACVRQALEQWNPADLDRLGVCHELLEQAVAGMRDFESALRGGAVSATIEARSTLLGMRQEIRQATRVVDACAAFHRGLATRLGNASPGYDAGGRPFAETPHMEGELHG